MQLFFCFIWPLVQRDTLLGGGEASKPILYADIPVQDLLRPLVLRFGNSEFVLSFTFPQLVSSLPFPFRLSIRSDEYHFGNDVIGTFIEWNISSIKFVIVVVFVIVVAITTARIIQTTVMMKMAKSSNA